jgi:3-dehydroquinate synthase
MMGAAMLSQRLGLLPQETVEQQRALIRKFSLPTNCPGVDMAGVLKAIELDKKIEERAVRWVLLKGVGEVVIRDDVPQEIITDVIEELLRG